MSPDSPEGRNLSNSGEDSKFLDQARQLLHKRLKVRASLLAVCVPGDTLSLAMKVVVKDGRILVGDFLCIDKQGNLILGNTYQQATRQVSLPSPIVEWP